MSKRYYDLFYLNVHHLNFRPSFFYFEEDGKKAIVPVLVNRKARVVTEFAPLDYYDVITNSDEHFVKVVFEYLVAQFPDYSFLFSRVNPDSLISRCGYVPAKTDVCVRIILDQADYSSYFDSLAKHQRQNIRTAYNKLQKIGIRYELKLYDAESPASASLWRELRQMYYSRRKALNQVSSNRLKVLYNKLNSPLFDIVRKSDSSRLFVLYFNDNPVAFIAALMDEKHSSLFVPVLTCNQDYVKLSPGTILMTETIDYLISHGVKTLDLARGNEPYKYAFGGMDFNNCTYSIGD